jgi:hypothetical protein
MLYHDCICFGGSCGSIVTIHHSSSIIGRLSALLLYLAKYSSEYHHWSQFLVDNWEDYAQCHPSGYSVLESGRISSSIIRWSCVTLSGHSQGCGHATYLAQQISMNRLVMLSGPQEGCWDHQPHWLISPFATQDVMGFMHVEEEGTAHLIRHCWSHLPLPSLIQTCVVDVVDGLSDLCLLSSPPLPSLLPPPRLLTTTLSPANHSWESAPAARPNHASLSTDRKTPLLVLGGSSVEHETEDEWRRNSSDDDIVPVYSKYVWPYLLLS